VQADVIKECKDNCPYNKVQEYGEKTIKTRFGKEVKVRVKIDSE
jgi:hypothetical protein